MHTQPHALECCAFFLLFQLCFFPNTHNKTENTDANGKKHTKLRQKNYIYFGVFIGIQHGAAYMHIYIYTQYIYMETI